MAKLSSRALAGAVVGAAALAGTVALVERNAFAPDHGQSEAGKEKCYGVALAGENACSSAGGEHSCGGQAKVDYSGHEWMMVPAGSCTQMGGKMEAFEGVSTPPPKPSQG